jgi:uncharacterized protein YkwD
MSRNTFKGLCAALVVLLFGAPAIFAVPAPALAMTPPHCIDAGVRPTASDVATVDAVTLCLVNGVRRSHHLRPLRRNPALTGVAASQVSGMVRQNYFADVSPSGVTPQALIAASPYPSAGGSFTIGQNLAWGTGSMDTPAAIVAAWMASPPHRSIILTASFRDAGVAATPAVPAVVEQFLAGATYAMEFGVRH